MLAIRQFNRIDFECEEFALMEQFALDRLLEQAIVGIGEIERLVSHRAP
jgi:hypothetical protein